MVVPITWRSVEHDDGRVSIVENGLSSVSIGSDLFSHARIQSIAMFSADEGGFGENCERRGIKGK
jgi:hypothetical protein